MADNDNYMLIDPLTSGGFDNFTTHLGHKSKGLLLSVEAQYDEYSSWKIYEAGTDKAVGSITLQFEPLRNELVFCWTDRDTHADIETEWKEALCILCIVHYRKNYLNK